MSELEDVLVYDDAGVQLYHEDCRRVIDDIAIRFDDGVTNPQFVVITDPIWPNGKRIFPQDEPWSLFAETIESICDSLNPARIIILLGCDSDVRFLAPVPKRFPYLRTVKLRYTRASYKGALLIDCDYGFIFGKAYRSGNGHRVLPSEGRAIGAGWKTQHPCPRHHEHMLWLVENFTRATDIVVDPFCGIGTIPWAAAKLGRRAIGIERVEDYINEAKVICETARTGIDPHEAIRGQLALFGRQP